MRNVLYSLADNNLDTDHVVKSIIEKLNHKYNKNFEVIKIGDRYGTKISNEATALCSIKNYDSFIFRAKYDMVEEKIICDNFPIRCTCFYIENEISRILKNVQSVVRAEISRKNNLDNVYKTEEFLEKFSQDCFIVTLIVEQHESNNFIKLLSKLQELYKKLKLNILVYEMDKKEFERFYNTSKNLENLSISYIETFQISKKQIYRIEDGIIKSC